MVCYTEWRKGHLTFDVLTRQMVCIRQFHLRVLVCDASETIISPYSSSSGGRGGGVVKDFVICQKANNA